MLVAKDAHYYGNLHNGRFHGSGSITFDDGGVFSGTWENGTLLPGSGSYTFPDGLIYYEIDWDYCTMKNRRFWSECDPAEDRQPDFSQETNIQPTPVLPYNHYDVGDGIYDPDNNVVHDYDGNFLREPDEDEKQWICQCCRYGLSEDVEVECKACLNFITSSVDGKITSKETKGPMEDEATPICSSVDEA